MSTQHRMGFDEAYGNGAMKSGDWAPAAFLKAVQERYPHLSWLNMTKETDCILLHGFIADRALDGFISIRVEAWSGEPEGEKSHLRGTVQFKGDLESAFRLDIPLPAAPSLRLGPFIQGLHDATVEYIQTENEAAVRASRIIASARLGWLGVVPA